MHSSLYAPEEHFSINIQPLTPRRKQASKIVCHALVSFEAFMPTAAGNLPPVVLLSSSQLPITIPSGEFHFIGSCSAPNACLDTWRNYANLPVYAYFAD
jgi:hypothetical protein